MYPLSPKHIFFIDISVCSKHWVNVALKASNQVVTVHELYKMLILLTFGIAQICNKHEPKYAKYLHKNLAWNSWSGCNGICLVFVYKKPDIYRCLCSNCDRCGFYAEIQIIFGTVFWMAAFSDLVLLEHIYFIIMNKH